MDPDCFLMALGHFPANVLADLVLFHLWDTGSGDTRTPKHSVPSCRADLAPLFISELRAVKQKEQQLEYILRTSYNRAAAGGPRQSLLVRHWKSGTRAHKPRFICFHPLESYG